ncbi:MAG: hypothetical protein U0R44_04730 [Candidatus Micrarchaeia archaeon]
MRYVVLALILAVFLAGCASVGGNQSGTGGGSANFQRCISQCGPGNSGNGSLCKDGCRVQEAEDTKSTSLCDQLDNQANRPSCYGTVAKSAGDIKVCERLTDATDKNYCVSIFGGPGTN